MRPCPLLLSQSLVRRRLESWDIAIGFAMVWGEGLFSFSVGLNGLPGGGLFLFRGGSFPLGWFGFTLFFFLILSRLWGV